MTARLCVFCGSNRGHDPAYAEATEALAAELVARDIDLVYGGGRVGLMGVLADAALAAGGEVIGVIPRHLEDRGFGYGRMKRSKGTASTAEAKAIYSAESSGYRPARRPPGPPDLPPERPPV